MLAVAEVPKKINKKTTYPQKILATYIIIKLEDGKKLEA